jgi:hypothetical protein
MVSHGYQVVITPVTIPFDMMMKREASLRSSYEGVRSFLVSWKNIVWDISVMPPDSFEYTRQFLNSTPLFMTSGRWWVSTLKSLRDPKDTVSCTVQFPCWLGKPDLEEAVSASIEEDYQIEESIPFPFSGPGIWAIDALAEYGDYLKSIGQEESAKSGIGEDILKSKDCGTSRVHNYTMEMVVKSLIDNENFVYNALDLQLRLQSEYMARSRKISRGIMDAISELGKGKE